MSTDINEDFTEPVPQHISDVDVWLHPDRNYYVFIALTFLFGFFGLDHMYLRSNETAFKKLLLNIFGLGIWYFWDIIQVLKDGRTVRQHGLNSPFDWIRGIGRGMFTAPTNTNDSSQAAQKYAAPKSYFLYTLFAICLGALGADKFYLGEYWMGAAKIFSVFNIFLFLFGILWVLWDAVHAYFDTAGIMKSGIKAPLPYSWFFKKPIDPSVFQVQPVREEPPQEEDDGFFGKWIPSLPSLPFRELYRELVVPLLQPSVGNAIQSANKVVSVGTKAAALGTAALSAGPALVGDLTNQINEQIAQATQGIVQGPAALTTQGLLGPKTGTSIAQVQQIAEKTAASRIPQPQMGGGNPSSGPGPILAGAFTAILLAGGLKGAYDFLAKQTA